MTKHTQGPWHTFISQDGETILIKPVFNGILPPPQVICEMDGLPNKVADAALIAAAPELYKVLEELVNASMVEIESGDVMERAKALLERVNNPPEIEV